MVNRLDSNLLDEPQRAVGPTVAAVAAIDGSSPDAGRADSPDGDNGPDSEDGEAPISRRSRFRVVS